MRPLSEREKAFLSLFFDLVSEPTDRQTFLTQVTRARVLKEDGEHLFLVISDPVPLLSADMEKEISRHALRFADVELEGEIIEALIHCEEGKIHWAEWFSYAPGRRLTAVPAIDTYLGHT